MQLAARWSCTYALLRVARARGIALLVMNLGSFSTPVVSFSFALIGNGRTGYRSRGRDTLPGNGDGHSKVRHALGHYTFGDDPHLTHIHFGQKGMFNSLHAPALENTQEDRRIWSTFANLTQFRKQHAQPTVPARTHPSSRTLGTVFR